MIPPQQVAQLLPFRLCKGPTFSFQPTSCEITAKPVTDGTFPCFSDIFFCSWLDWPESLLRTFRIT